MNENQTLAEQAADYIRTQSGIDTHDIALVLGSGWGGAAELIGPEVSSIDSADIPGFGAAAVAGHNSTTRSIAIGDTGKHALVLGSRTHLYEGKGVARVVHGVRTAAALGARVIILTNGAGGLAEFVEPGHPVVIRDHINLTAQSPIEGANFVDLTDLYSRRLRQMVHDDVLKLHEGVYAQLPGPHYETPAEIQYLRTIGADLVGMSTALEAIAARQAGLEVLAFSLVTNLAAGISPVALSHEEVIEAGQQAGPRMSQLLARVVARIGEDLEAN